MHAEVFCPVWVCHELVTTTARNKLSETKAEVHLGTAFLLLDGSRGMLHGAVALPKHGLDDVLRRKLAV